MGAFLRQQAPGREENELDIKWLPTGAPGRGGMGGKVKGPWVLWATVPVDRLFIQVVSPAPKASQSPCFGTH